MTTTRSTEPAEASLTRDLLYAARYYLGNRRGLLVLVGLTLLAGLALNWSWLLAVGIAPILISVLPCVAMCALGLCMNKMAGKSCATDASHRDPTATTAHEALPMVQAAAPEPLPSPAAGDLPGKTIATPLTKPEPEALEQRSTTDA